MDKLNLPAFPFKIIKEEGKYKILDPIRRKYLVITPEEWVRQHFIQFLITEKSYPKGLLKLENQIKHGQTTGRFDALFLDNKGKPLLLIECKAPSITIDRETFYQVARYNNELKVPFFALTNGKKHFFLELDFKDGTINVLPEIPTYQYLVNQSTKA
jgi:hypothetical protein